MDKHRQKVWKKRHSRRSKRMGWKSKRNKEVKIYITIFLVCAAIAGVIAFMTGKAPSLIQKTVDKQITRRAEEVLGGQLKELGGAGGMEGMDSKRMQKLKKKYGGMMK
ncbi:MAG: hypothetical protein HN402_01865 [Candidatus Scalindua sp.]|jgi:hypothetical protein|nr:hypothetical protein [Candidatus Scalindua sp.]